MLTGDQVHGDKHRTQGRQLRKHIVDLVVRIRHLDGNLSKVIGVGSGEDLFVVVQVLGHGDQVVLDVGEVKTLREDESNHEHSARK